MRFAPYIKFISGYVTRFNRVHIALLVLLTLSMSGCSSKADKQNDLKSMSKALADLVGFPLAEQSQSMQSANHTQLLLSEYKNAYLEQEARLMSGVPNKIREIYQQALNLMAQKKWVTASELFDQVIAKQANLSGSYVNQAIINLALSKQLSKQQNKAQSSNYTEQLDAAELWLDKAISVNPTNPYAHYYKGKLLQDRGQFEQAEQHYTSALAIWPRYSQVQLSMAILLELYRGKLLEAYPYYSAYLQHNSDDQQVQRWQAALAIKIKRAGLDLPEQAGE